MTPLNALQAALILFEVVEKGQRVAANFSELKRVIETARDEGRDLTPAELKKFKDLRRLARAEWDRAAANGGTSGKKS